MSDFKIFSEVTDKSAWTSAVQKILKDQPVSSLNWTISDHLSLDPYYKASDIKGFLDTPTAIERCKLRQVFNIKHRDTKDLNKIIIQALEHGLESLVLVWTTTPNQHDFDEVLSGVHMNMVHIHIITQHYEDWVLMMDILKIKCQLDQESHIQGSVICLKDEFKIFNYVIDNQLFNLYPKLRFWQVSGKNLEDLLIKGYQILSNAIDYSMGIDEITARIQFIIPMTPVLIESVANIKTFRLLWALIVDAYKPQHECSRIVYIITQNDTETYFLQEPLVYNNILKQTAQVMSSMIGTADECQIELFDTTQTLEFAHRISRNIMHLLREESFLGQNKDPLRGAYVLEALIQKKAELVWGNILPHLQ